MTTITKEKKKKKKKKNNDSLNDDINTKHSLLDRTINKEDQI